MSTIVVVRKGNMVSIAADTQTSFGSGKLRSKYAFASDKIFKAGGSYIAMSGWSACQDALEDIASRKKVSFNFKSKTEIFRAFQKIHVILKKEYFLETDDADETSQPVESSQMNILIANKYGIFGVTAFRDVYEYSRFWADGSGFKLALGAMYATYDGAGSSEDIAKTGVMAGVEFDSGSGAPIICHSIKLAVKRKR